MTSVRNAGPYAIGSTHLPGVSKLIEELGELGQALGKLLGTGGNPEHWDGAGDLHDRITSEMGDVQAAIHLVLLLNSEFSATQVEAQMVSKVRLFTRWHFEQTPERIWVDTARHAASVWSGVQLGDGTVDAETGDALFRDGNSSWRVDPAGTIERVPDGESTGETGYVNLVEAYKAVRTAPLLADQSYMSAEAIMGAYVPGSGDWSWDEERSKLVPFSQEMVVSIATHGIQVPVLLGDDGRVWEGHNRVLIAEMVGVTVPVVHGTNG